MATAQQAAQAVAPVGEWRLDPALSAVAFRIRTVFRRWPRRLHDLSGTLRVSEQQIELSASARRPRVDLEVTEATLIAFGAFLLGGELIVDGLRRPIELISATHAHDNHLHLHAEGSFDRPALLRRRTVEVEIDALFRRVG